jgi:hypothetical protein
MIFKYDSMSLTTTVSLRPLEKYHMRSFLSGLFHGRGLKRVLIRLHNTHLNTMLLVQSSLLWLLNLQIKSMCKNTFLQFIRFRVLQFYSLYSLQTELNVTTKVINQNSCLTPLSI